MYLDTQDMKLKHGKVFRRVLLRESYREKGKVKKRTIANLSKLPPDLINAIQQALKGGTSPIKYLDASQQKTTLGSSIGALFTLDKICKNQGIDKALGSSKEAQLIKWMIHSQIIRPGSKLAAVRLAEQHAVRAVLGLEEFDENDLYNALDWLEEHQRRIEKRLFKIRYGNESPTLYLYDVTSSYLEGTENELADFGYNRDKKKGKKQIVIGLLTDGEGMPVSVTVFPGNTPDTTTFYQQIRTLADDFGVEHVVMVGDKGMIKNTQIKDIKEYKFHYITSITKAQIRTLMKNGVIQTGLFDDNLCEVSHDDNRYILRKNPVREREIRQNRESKINKVKWEITKANIYLRDHERAKVETALSKVNTLVEKLKLADFIEITLVSRVLSLLINKEKLQDLSLLDGCYVIKTDVSKTVADTELVHDRYKDLAKVERDFRTMKVSQLEIRPLYLRNAARTRAHVFIVMLALMITKHLQVKWKDAGLTVDEGIDELVSICTMTMEIASHTFNTIPAPRPAGKRLLKRLNITLPKTAPQKENDVATK